LSGAAGSVDVGALLGQAVGGGVAGAIVTAVVGLIKTKMAYKPNVRFGSKADIRAAKSHVRFTDALSMFATLPHGGGYEIYQCLDCQVRGVVAVKVSRAWSNAERRSTE